MCRSTGIARSTLSADWCYSVKLQRQIAQFGASSAGTPPPWVYESTDGELVIFNGITRATRIAKRAPGTLLCVDVIGKLRAAFGSLPTSGDLLP